MTIRSIEIRAENDNGPKITVSKAATIVKLGGWVSIVALDPGSRVPAFGLTATVHGGNVFNPQPPAISGSGLSRYSIQDAEDHIRLLQNAIAIVRDAEKQPSDTYFATVPLWVKRSLPEDGWTEEGLRLDAVKVYCSGLLNYADSWKWAIGQVKRGEEVK